MCAKYIGTLTSDARGKLGGLVMTRGRNGTNLKAHGVGVHPRSVYQQANRSALAAAVAAWRTLNQSEMTTWALLAAQYTYLNSLAQSYSPTALQLWTQAWMNAATVGAVPPGTTSTTPESVTPIVSITIAHSTPHFYAYAYSATGPYAGNWSISSSAVIQPTVLYTRGIRRRPMGAGVAASAIPIDLAFVDAWGNAFTFGDTLNVRVVPFGATSYVSGTPAAFSVVVT